MRRRINPHPVFVEKAIENIRRRQRGRNHLAVRTGAQQHDGASPVLDADFVLASLARLFVGELLDHDAARAPLPVLRVNRQHKRRLYLFGLRKIMLHGVHHRIALQLDNALITRIGAALVDGKGHVALFAEQVVIVVVDVLLALGGLAHGRLVKARIGAHLPLAAHIGDQHPHGAVALYLERKDALEFQHAAQKQADRHDFGQDGRDGRRVVVLEHHLRQHGAKTHHAPAHVGFFQTERLDDVVIHKSRLFRAVFFDTNSHSTSILA